ncbi:MAG: hypothetical protein AAF191_10445 [Verrucomicrobiota bacterium]
MEGLYRAFYENLSLQNAGILLGLGLILSHGAALWKKDLVRNFLPKFPRHQQAGMILLIICAVWSFLLMLFMDLGEFYNIRKGVLILIPFATYLVIQYVPEFLAVRALGILMLLAASPLLNAAFLKAPVTRLLLPILAYVWIWVGIFLVGMPYLLRDWINWFLKGGETMWKRACYGGLGYGTLTLICALAFWGGV